MITFFRRIRENLIASGSLTKYLIYAIGEIALVMIGILLALQVNNWNEERKQINTELNYLVGIKTDLENDIPVIQNQLIITLTKISRFSKIDPAYIPGRGIQALDDVSIDSIRISQMVNRGPSFRLTSATYTSLSSNASADMIKNVSLLHAIQELYYDMDRSTHSIYDDLKRREEYIGWKYAYEIKYSDLDRFFIDNPDKEEILADFDFYYRQHALMYAHLTEKRDLMLDIINDIETELKERI